MGLEVEEPPAVVHERVANVPLETPLMRNSEQDSNPLAASVQGAVHVSEEHVLAV